MRDRAGAAASFIIYVSICQVSRVGGWLTHEIFILFLFLGSGIGIRFWMESVILTSRVFFYQSAVVVAFYKYWIKGNLSTFLVNIQIIPLNSGHSKKHIVLFYISHIPISG